MNARTLLLALLPLALALAARPAASQWDDEPRRPTGFYAGGSLAYADPRGEFADFVDDGFGGTGHVLYALGGSPFALRLDGGVVVYGRERQRVPLSSTIGGRILVDLETTNNIAFIGVGPQIGVPSGRLSPYVNGFAGVSYLYTESSVEGTRSDEEFASTTNFDDAVFSWGAGGGLYVPLRRGASPISLDLGVVYHVNGEARYLREGGIIDNPDGSITLRPVRSEADLLTVRLGVSVGISR